MSKSYVKSQNVVVVFIQGDITLGHPSGRSAMGVGALTSFFEDLQKRPNAPYSIVVTPDSDFLWEVLSVGEKKISHFITDSPKIFEEVRELGFKIEMYLGDIGANLAQVERDFEYLDRIQKEREFVESIQ